jgi:hypothetical protein
MLRDLPRLPVQRGLFLDCKAFFDNHYCQSGYNRSTLLESAVKGKSWQDNLLKPDP